MDVDDSIGNQDDITVEIDGHDYLGHANLDLDADGVTDAVGFDTEDGATVYADTDHDGRADSYYELDERGNVERSAVFSDGVWSENRDSGSVRVRDEHGGDRTVDADRGEIDSAQATIDSDNDGRADTAIVDDGHGGTILYTDTDGDGKVDVSTQLGADDAVTVSRYDGDGHWTEVERGQVDARGDYQRAGASTDEWIDNGDAGADELWGAGSTGGANGGANVVRIDARTGQWISPN